MGKTVLHELQALLTQKQIPDYIIYNQKDNQEHHKGYPDEHRKTPFGNRRGCVSLSDLSGKEFQITLHIGTVPMSLVTLQSIRTDQAMP